nr:site-specific DNA-methyltransferase [Methanobrevibacter sp.]
MKLTSNPETSGRYHSNWLNMMYPRLKLARNLLRDDGVIFISIDDNEIENLKKLCNEIFGEENFIGQFNWYKSETPPNLSKKIKKNIEYILVYEKILNNSKYEGIMKFSKSDNGLLNQTNSEKTLIFPKNIVKTKLKNQVLKKGYYGTDNYKIILEEDTEIKDGIFIKEIKLTSKFKWSQEKLLNEIRNNTIISIKTQTLSPSYEKDSYDPEVPKNFIDKSVNVDTTENAGKYLKKLFGNKKIFDYPKPVSLMRYLLNFSKSENDEIYLDFFSGSASTAESIFELNIENKQNNKFILVQIPENIDDNTDAFKEGYRNICEIGKERIRRAGDKIVEESENSDLDIGFKVFKLDSSNLEKWDPDYNNLQQSLTIDNIKEDRTNEDLVYEIMLKYGIDLTLPIEEHNNIYSIGFGALVICLDNNITKEIANEIIKLTKNSSSSRVVFKDSGFKSDADKTNIKEILKINHIDEFITI